MQNSVIKLILFSIWKIEFSYDLSSTETTKITTVTTEKITSISTTTTVASTTVPILTTTPLNLKPLLEPLRNVSYELNRTALTLNNVQDELANLIVQNRNSEKIMIQKGTQSILDSMTSFYQRDHEIEKDRQQKSTNDLLTYLANLSSRMENSWTRTSKKISQLSNAIKTSTTDSSSEIDFSSLLPFLHGLNSSIFYSFNCLSSSIDQLYILSSDNYDNQGAQFEAIENQLSLLSQLIMKVEHNTIFHYHEIENLLKVEKPNPIDLANLTSTMTEWFDNMKLDLLHEINSFYKNLPPPNYPRPLCNCTGYSRDLLYVLIGLTSFSTFCLLSFGLKSIVVRYTFLT